MLLSRKKFLQQTGLACAATMLPFSKLFSAELRKPLTLDTRHPKNCTQNLVDNTFYDLDFIEEDDFTYYKDTGPTAKDILYKLEENVTACVDTSPPGFPQKICDVTNNHDDEDISVLRYHAYYPRSAYSGEDTENGHDYETVPLPLLLLFHPGGFQECIGYIPPGIKIVCQQLARRGFVCITADYRAGRVKDLSDPTKVSVQQQMAPYRAIQDGRGAIRTIFKRNDETGRGGHNFKINPNQFFIGGQSAGAVVASGIAYYRNQAMINEVFPIDTGSLSIEDALGHINADYYYGEPGDLEDPDYTPRIRAVLNCWGGISIPKSFDENATYPNPDLGKVEKGFFEAVGSEDANKINPPMIAFVGNNDAVIPVPDLSDDQDFINSNTLAFRKENVCLENAGNFIIKSSGTLPDLDIYVKSGSSQNMYYILKELNRFTEFYVDCDMGHGIHDYEVDNFDVNTHLATSPDLVFTYIAVRAGIFFQTCMNVSPYTNYPPFNYRGKSLFISTDDDANDHVINHRICADYCTGTPLGATCSTGTDTPCD